MSTTKVKVKIYTTATCAYCHAEKEYLKQHDIPYEEVAVDTDPAAAREMIELSGQMGVPFTVIGSGDDAQQIVGFDQPRIAAALGL
jgi:glutaredoxin-like YruB-family protein